MAKVKLNTTYCNDDAADEICALVEKYGLAEVLGCFPTASLMDEIKERIAESPYGLDNVVAK